MIEKISTQRRKGAEKKLFPIGYTFMNAAGKKKEWRTVIRGTDAKTALAIFLRENPGVDKAWTKS